MRWIYALTVVTVQRWLRVDSLVETSWWWLLGRLSSVGLGITVWTRVVESVAVVASVFNVLFCWMMEACALDPSVDASETESSIKGRRAR